MPTLEASYGQTRSITQSPVVLAALLLGLAALLLAANFGPSLASGFFVMLAAGSGIAAFARAQARILAAPSLVLVLGISATGWMGFLFVDSFFDGASRGISAQLTLSGQRRVQTLWLFQLAATALLLGGLSAIFTMRSVTIERLKRGGERRTHVGRPSVLAVLPFATLAILIVGMGPANVWTNAEYLQYPGSNVQLLRLGGVLGLIGVVAAAMLIHRSRTLFRLLGLVALCALTAVYISQGTRRLALVPLLYMFGAFLAGRRITWLRVIAIALCSAVLLALPLHFRAQDDHGLLGHLSSLNEFSWFDLDLNELAPNVLFSYPLTSYVAFDAPAIPVDRLWVSIDPRPGQMAGWYEISEQMRINIFTPYSALGELGNHGSNVLVFYCFTVGFVFSWLARLQVHGRRNVSSLGTIGALRLMILVVLAFAAMLMMIQYNLRSSTRVILYAVILCGAAFAKDVAVRADTVLVQSTWPGGPALKDGVAAHGRVSTGIARRGE